MVERIDAVIAKTGDDFRVFSADGAPPKEAEIKALETALGRALPADYRAFLADVNEEVWPRPQAYEVRPHWQMEFARFVHGLAARTPPDFLVRDATQAFAKRAPGFIAILRAPGSVAVEGYDAKGRWVRWNGDELEPTEFASFTDAVVAAFEELIADRERLHTEPIES